MGEPTAFSSALCPHFCVYQKIILKGLSAARVFRAVSFSINVVSIVHLLNLSVRLSLCSSSGEEKLWSPCWLIVYVGLSVRSWQMLSIKIRLYVLDHRIGHLLLNNRSSQNVAPKTNVVLHVFCGSGVQEWLGRMVLPLGLFVRLWPSCWSGP